MPTIPGCTEHHIAKAVLHPSWGPIKTYILGNMLARFGQCTLAIWQCALFFNPVLSTQLPCSSSASFCLASPLLTMALVQRLSITATWKTPVISSQKGCIRGYSVSGRLQHCHKLSRWHHHIQNWPWVYTNFQTHLVKLASCNLHMTLVKLPILPTSCQYLFSKVSVWLVWSGMAARVPKWQCVSLQGSTGRYIFSWRVYPSQSLPTLRDF